MGTKQNILINNLTDREKKIDMSTYKNYSNFEEFDLATRYPDKYKVLQEQGISATTRRTLGSDIAGACGQLRRSSKIKGESENGKKID